MKVCDHLKYMCPNYSSQRVFKSKEITVFQPENRPYFWVLQLFFMQYCSYDVVCIALQSLMFFPFTNNGALVPVFDR